MTNHKLFWGNYETFSKISLVHNGNVISDDFELAQPLNSSLIIQWMI